MQRRFLYSAFHTQLDMLDHSLGLFLMNLRHSKMLASPFKSWHSFIHILVCWFTFHCCWLQLATDVYELASQLWVHISSRYHNRNIHLTDISPIITFSITPEFCWGRLCLLTLEVKWRSNPIVRKVKNAMRQSSDWSLWFSSFRGWFFYSAFHFTSENTDRVTTRCWRFAVAFVTLATGRSPVNQKESRGFVVRLENFQKNS